VKALAIEGISATPATIADGSYPLYITLYLAAKSDSPKQPAIDRFIAFLNSDTAKTILRKHDLVPYSDATDAIARNATRTAFIDAHLNREPTTAAGAVAAVTPAPAAAAVPPPTPVSAPRAVLESKSRIAPTAESTEAARQNLARAEAAKQEKKEAAAKSEKQVAKTEPAPKAEPKAPAKKKAAVAKTEKPAKKEEPKASFGNVDAAAKTAEKPASFGDVNAGAKSSTDPAKN
ncbi:MAG TPA: hypothetical protein VFL30_01180, partial [Rhodanobacteraceae bacterium]|nr:hypothetical protein [Rhodanobacteraceae bacterium]